MHTLELPLGLLDLSGEDEDTGEFVLDLRSDVAAWLAENVTGRWKLDDEEYDDAEDNGIRFNIIFASAEDAALFRVSWL